MLITAQGTPHPQPRPRFVKGRAVSVVSKPVKLWRSIVKRAALAALKDGGHAPLSGAVAVEMEFRFKLVQVMKHAAGQPHTNKPDADNLAKLVMDVFQEAGVFADDSRVSSLTVRKLWAMDGGCVVRIDPACDQAVISLDDAKPDWL